MSTKCCLCYKEIEAQAPAILTHGGFGHPRCLCADCEALLDTAIGGKTPQQVREALRTLADMRIQCDGFDRATEQTLLPLMEQGAARMQAMENGTYAQEPETESEDAVSNMCDDAAAVCEENAADDAAETPVDEPAEQDLYDIPEELRESAEDRAMDEVVQARERAFDKYFQFVWLGVIIGFVVVMIYLLFIR